MGIAKDVITNDRAAIDLVPNTPKSFINTLIGVGKAKKIPINAINKKNMTSLCFLFLRTDINAKTKTVIPGKNAKLS